MRPLATGVLVMNDRSRQIAAMRFLAALGIATPILDVVVSATLAALDPNYSHLRNFLSELGEEGRPYAAAFNVWCVIYGLMFAGFAIALGRALQSWSVAAALLAIAILSAASGAFPCDPECKGTTWTAKVHMAIGHFGVPAMVLAPFVCWRVMRERPEWRSYGAFSFGVGVLMAVAAAWLAAGFYTGQHAWWCPMGLAQRTLLGIQYVWLVVVAVRLLASIGREELKDSDQKSAVPAECL